MKKFLKVIVILSIIISFCVLIPKNSSFAYDYKTQLTDADGWTGKDTGVTNATKNVVGVIIQVIRIVGTGVAIVMLTYVAIKYMSAAPSEKADFKKSATAYIVGAIVLFATTNILSIISNFATSNIEKVS